MHTTDEILPNGIVHWTSPKVNGKILYTYGCCGIQAYRDNAAICSSRKKPQSKCASCGARKAYEISRTFRNPYKEQVLDRNGYRLINVSKLNQHDRSLLEPMMQKCYIAEHRLVVALNIGRPLTRYETVHHIDGDKLNNDLSNLSLLGLRDHQMTHREVRNEISKLRRRVSDLESELNQLRQIIVNFIEPG